MTGRDASKIDRLRGTVAGAHSVDALDPVTTSRFFADIGTFEHLVLAFSPGPVGIERLRDVDFEQVRTAVTDKVLPYLWAIREADVTASVTVISASGPRAAVPGTVAISAANGAIEGMISPLAAELAPVRVNAVAPGVIDTDWWDFLAPDDRDARFAAAAENVPLGRVGTADDVAEAIAYLVHADYVTSTIMAVDGGFTTA